jgi:exodeoxyribonuclease V beta subunit
VSTRELACEALPVSRSSVLTTAPAVFDVCGELPSGTTVLEASAGTGKTFTIAALAARYVAEGHATLPELMLVTFGREATQELRERVRERLVSAERGLAAPAVARAGRDRVLALLASAPEEEVARRRRRLAEALAHFDAATIATTHQFCQRMLEGLGVAADTDPGAVFVESVDDLLTEVVDDFYVRKYAPGEAGRPAFSRETALAIARRAVADPQARLEPRDAPAGSAAHVRQAFAGAVRAEVGRRKLRAGVYTYDDMLSRLRDTLADPARGPGACARLRARYRTVLVDEFQDTDPVQWEILQRAFSGHVTLVLIGDPKQAIYAFRGADVVSYLDAVGSADHHATLGVSWRSDGPLLTALERVFGGVALGDHRIVAHRVGAAHPGRRLVAAAGDAPLRLRVVPRAGLPATPRKDHVVVGPARQRVAVDLAADVTALLASGAQLEGRPVAPGDVAVLVRTNDQAGLVHEALAAAGVPAVLTGSASVFATPVAAQWLTLLEAVEQPQRSARVRAAALTCFLGRTVEELCGADAERLLDELGATLRRWSGALQERGVAALLEAVTTSTGLPARLLARTDGERTLTDLRHIGQALHRAAIEGHLGPGALVEWLRHRIAAAAEDTGSERSRRLESDAAAVQIVTVHRSKGCEFGIVYVPFGWDRYTGEPEVALLHEHGARVLDVGGPAGEGWRERCERHRAEEAGEDLRLLYVAMTRARCQVVTWWVPASTTAGSPLHRLLFGGAERGSAVAASYRVPADPPPSTRCARSRRRSSPSRRSRSGPRAAGRRREVRPRGSPRPRSADASIHPGGARPTARSPPPATPPRRTASPRSAGPPTSRRRPNPPRPPRPIRTPPSPRCRRRWPRCRWARRSARSCMRSWRRSTRPRPI